jgi:RNA polymerase sigma factor (TIGR02999 family)
MVFLSAFHYIVPLGSRHLPLQLLPVGHARGILLAMSGVTQILSAIEQGDSAAGDQLFPLVYDELRRLAAHRMMLEKPGQTLSATGLVHEAYLRLVDVEKAQCWNSRGHFFAAAAEAMRRILVESARRKQRTKHGGDQKRVELTEEALAADKQDKLVLSIDESLSALAQQNAQAAELVKLRFFGGLTLPEAAAALDVSPRTADRLWAYARAWLLQELQP